ncbi:MAG: DNA topoisomerase 4 subunit A [Firmicutes bacterium]|nr:DNA topoisomerase 4 subunit A [Bacillota bacterium]
MDNTLQPTEIEATNQPEKRKPIYFKTLEEVMHESMMPYSEHVILERALPRVEDGLKPVQRRILYTMYEMGLSPEKPYKKSARVVGDALGKYHPHGDKSVYDAMVRLAQPFNMRELLVSGHGNFGSIDGDSPAAMRYTEVRLAPLSLELLRDIEKDTVTFSPNFDDSLKEPQVLPGRFPNLLVNGATGIAIGLATNIPPHNLSEVIDGVIAYINNPRISLSDMLKVIKGPDFPGGGNIIGGDELYKAYLTGKGRIQIRASIHIELADNDRRNIVITQLPFQVNKATLLQKIMDLREERKGVLSGISEIVDESDRHGMRAVIRVKRDVDPRLICEILFKSTDLQTTFAFNMVAIADGKPQLMGLLDIIAYYANYQRIIVLNRTKFDLKAAEEREHILEGLVIAVENIDNIIKIIKASANPSEAKQTLRQRYTLSDRQAQAILDMRLARLTSLEVVKLKKELEEIRILIVKLKAILNSKKLQMDLIKDELTAIKRAHKDARRSAVHKSADEVFIQSEDDEKPIEDFAITYNASDSLKRVPQKNFNQSDKNLTEKSGLNEIVPLLVETQNNYILYVFTNYGNCYKIDVDMLPEGRWREKGNLFKSIAKDSLPGEFPVEIFPIGEFLPMGNLLMFTRQGMVKRSSWADYSITKSSFQAIKMKDGDELIGVEHDTTDTSVLFVTQKGMVLNAEKSDIPMQGRVAGGVRGMNLSDSDQVILATQVTDEDEVAVITDNGFAKKVPLAEIDVTPRYRKGLKIMGLTASLGLNLIFASYTAFPHQIALIGSDNKIIPLTLDEIKKQNRTGKGNPIKKQFAKGVRLKTAHKHLSEGKYITFNLDL